MKTDDKVMRGSRIARNEEIVFNEMDGEIVMMSVERGEYFGLNSIGGRIWGMLERPCTAAEIIDRLRPDFDVESDRLAEDVLAFLNHMVSQGIVRFAP